MSLSQMIALYWPYIALGALVLIALVAWGLIARRRTAIVRHDEDSAPVEASAPRRNQALIDAPPVAPRGAEATAPPRDPCAAPAAAPVAAPAPTSFAASAPPEPSAKEGDDLTRIKGLGPKIATLLAEMGVTRFEQIAAWSEADIERIDAQLSRFAGRIRRDRWVEQARLLAAGDEEGYAATFGNQG